jgi:hypothetical protein
MERSMLTLMSHNGRKALACCDSYLLGSLALAMIFRDVARYMQTPYRPNRGIPAGWQRKHCAGEFYRWLLFSLRPRAPKPQGTLARVPPMRSFC